MSSFGIEFIPDKPVSEIVKLAKLAEQVGFKNIWITDHYNNRNLWVTLTAIALATKTIKIGPGVTNPYHTSPALSAAAAVTLNEVSNGRAVVGLGAGDKVTLDTLGLEWKKPVTTVIEAIHAMKALISGKRLSFEGKVFHFQNAKLANVKKEIVKDKDGRPIKIDSKTLKLAPKIPIYSGAQGPMMLTETAKYVDGVLVNASHPLDFEVAIQRIKMGVKEADRNLQEIDIGAYTAFSIADSEKEAMKGDTKVVVAFIVAGSPDSILERHHIDLEDGIEIRECLTRGDFNGASQLVTNDMINSFAIVGTPEYCTKRIEELFNVGVTHFVVGSPIGPNKSKAIKLIGKKILPRFLKRG